MARETAAQIRAQLGHPVIDADGHWIESAPVFADFIRDAGGAALADEYLKRGSRQPLGTGGLGRPVPGLYHRHVDPRGVHQGSPVAHAWPQT